MVENTHRYSALYTITIHAFNLYQFRVKLLGLVSTEFPDTFSQHTTPGLLAQPA